MSIGRDRRRALSPRPATALRYAVLLILPLLGFLAWQVTIWLAAPEAWLLPSPRAVGEVLWDERARLWFHARATIGAALIGFALAALIGTALAVAMNAWRPLQRTLHPWLVASQAIPILSLAPLMAVWFGYGTTQMMVAFVVSFFPVVVTGNAGLRAVDPALTGALLSLGAHPWQAFVRVTLPGALPSLFAGLKLAAVFSVTGAVVGEYVGADRGLGYLTEFSTAQFRTDRSFAAVFLLGLIGVGFFAAIALLERLALPHRHRATRPHWRIR